MLLMPRLLELLHICFDLHDYEAETDTCDIVPLSNNYFLRYFSLSSFPVLLRPSSGVSLLM